MKKNLLLGLVAASLLAQNAMADGSYIRPGRYPEVPPLPQPLPLPPGPVQQSLEGRVEIQNITRQSGGAWYRVSLQRPLRLDRVEIAPSLYRLKIHEAWVYTQSGQRLAIQELQNVDILNVGDRAVSEALNTNVAIVALDIRAESYGGFANMSVSAFSSEDRPALVVGNLPPQPPVPPQRPEPRPDRPDGRPGGRPEPRPDRCGGAERVGFVLQRLSQDIDSWAQRMGQSTYGSTQYVMAQQQLRNSAARLVQYAQSDEVTHASLQALEQQGAVFLNKMNTYTYGSEPYNAYKSVSDTLFNSMLGALDIALSCEIRSTQELTDKAASFIAKMNQYTYGSTPYVSYNKLVVAIFQKAPAYFENEARMTRKPYRQLSSDLESFIQKSNSYTYASIPYNGFVELAKKAGQLSEEQLRSFVGYLNPNERFELVRYFDGRKDQFTYGSLAFNHYKNMRDIVANAR